ncbi:phage Gp37/Gp68 family protein [Peribacillus simplex]|uniref:Phage Gp37/Gp68 family protein n=2 Tax=Peribacillus TaxID=2675229 RepID=A0AA90PEE6_9BACI|nr:MULTISPECIES: phage Gp37/Gp68 family protein [Peribacillus]MDP1421678.1 phage Gp37/Gp68 family protein [Peribacillus simplex]MDP1454398.1 phage Gp37/Gp68 family protein [Peribacillus frigoritolerans]
MAGNSSIEWTEATWNPVTGCNKVSDGCKHCYAERMAKRLHAMRNPRYANGFNVTLHPDLIDTPRKWAKPRKVFVNSMSDLFHKQVPDDFISDVFKTMNETPQHSYQILTKRPERVVEISKLLDFTPNIWMGTSVENIKVTHRIDLLKQVPANVRFLSCEPLLGPLDDLNLSEIHWVIVGGESGPGARPMEADWVRSIRDQCENQNVAFFFKQWGGVQKHRFGRELDNRTYNEYPLQTLAK